VQWLPDGRGLIVAYRKSGVSAVQLWRVDIATGEAAAVTRDLFNYNDVGVSADGSAIVAVTALGESTLWTAEPNRLATLQQITTGAADGEGFLGVAWTADGNILYTSRASGNADIWSLDSKSGVRRQLTSDASDDIQPAVAPDGKSIAFVSDRHGGRRIWVMHADGGNARAVTAGPADILPVWTPDSASIIFVAAREPRMVSVNGGAERSLQAYWPARAGEPARTFQPRAISPQGLVAGFEEVDSQRGGGWRLAYAPLDRSAAPTLLELTVGSSLGAIIWSPDGKAIDYSRIPDAGNVWRYPIDGRRGFRLTSLSGSAATRAVAWSPKGQLLMSRGENKTDVVLFKRAK
jgi:Tol biopolymer transport system component